MGLGRCLCAASTRSSSGSLLAEPAAGQAEGWWTSSASPIPCAPSLDAPAAIESAAGVQFSRPASGAGQSPDMEERPLLPSAGDAGSEKMHMSNSLASSRATGISDGMRAGGDEEPHHALISQERNATPEVAGMGFAGPAMSDCNTNEVANERVQEGLTASPPTSDAATPLALHGKGRVSTAVYAKNLEMKLEDMEGARKGLELELRAMKNELQKVPGNPDEQQQLQELLVNDLKQQLANSEGARALAENQLIELRITQKAVGQPTECVSLQGRRFTTEEVFAELEMRDRQIDELEAKAAVHASELTHAHLERDWAKDEQQRAEEALAKSRTRKVNGQSYTHEEACWELEKTMAQVKVLVATNEAYGAAERSENDVWQIALKDMSTQLQVTSSERAACQTAMLRLQDSLAEQTRTHSEAVKELQAQVENLDAERTCIELELTNVKAERDTVAKRLAAAQTTCKELSSQWEKLQGTGKSASVSDSQSGPQELTQKLECAENQVERLSSCLANEQIARDLVTKQLVTVTKGKNYLGEKLTAQGNEISRLKSEIAELKLRTTSTYRKSDRQVCSLILPAHHTRTPRASNQSRATGYDTQSALKVPPNKVPELGSPDVAALLVPFHDRLVAFEAKHRKAGTEASQAGTACCTPRDAEGKKHRGAAEALVRALQVSREAYADALRAQEEDDGEQSEALGDVGNVFRNKGRSRSIASSDESLGQRSAAEWGGKSHASDSRRQGSVAGARKKGTVRSCTASEHDSVSEELAKLTEETEQQNTSASADVENMGSNADRLNQYLQKLQKDLDDCLKDSHSVEEDAPHSARSSSTGILSEAPMVRHEKAKQRNQQMAEKHKHIIETMQGVISLVVSSGRLKGQEHTQQKEPAQQAVAADTRHVSASANNYDVFCMLEDALDENHGGGYSLRASVAPSHVSSTTGPFKMNSWKMQTESQPLIDLNKSGESGAAPPFGRSTSAAASMTRRNSNLPVLNALSLPLDRDRAQSTQLRSERFTLEEVREEHIESFKSAYPHKEGSGKVEAPTVQTSTTPAAEKQSAAPRRWSMLRMFTTGKKSDGPASPASTPTAASAGASTGGPTPYGQTAPDSRHSMMHGSQPPPQPSAPFLLHQDSIRSGGTLHDPHSSHGTQRRPSSGHHAGFSAGADPYQFSTPNTTPQWYTPAANSGTPSFITPGARNSDVPINAGQPRDVLRAAQQATPEQARAVLQKFQSIRSRQRAQSGLAAGL